MNGVLANVLTAEVFQALLSQPWARRCVDCTVASGGVICIFGALLCFSGIWIDENERGKAPTSWHHSNAISLNVLEMPLGGKVFGTDSKL